MNVRLLVVQGKQRGQYLTFPNGDFVFGRGPECHIRPDSDWVSRQHCLLTVGNEGASLRDLGSTNGTLVNGHRILEEFPLRQGDRVQVGPLVLEVEFIGGNALAPTAKALQDEETVKGNS